MKPTNVPRWRRVSWNALPVGQPVRLSQPRKRADRRLRRETWAVILAAGALLTVILWQALSYGN
jgi:hypothetical protein